MYIYICQAHIQDANTVWSFPTSSSIYAMRNAYCMYIYICIYITVKVPTLPEFSDVFIQERNRLLRIRMAEAKGACMCIHVNVGEKYIWKFEIYKSSSKNATAFQGSAWQRLNVCVWVGGWMDMLGDWNLCFRLHSARRRLAQPLFRYTYGIMHMWVYASYYTYTYIYWGADIYFIYELSCIYTYMYCPRVRRRLSQPLFFSRSRSSYTRYV